MLLSEWLQLKGMTIPRIGKDVEKPELSLIAGRIVNWFNHFEKLVDNIYQSQTSCTHNLAIPLLNIYPIKTGDSIHQETCTRKDTAALFIIAMDWKQLRYPSTEEWIYTLWYINTMENYTIKN